jgi:hypothetical protein
LTGKDSGKRGRPIGYRLSESSKRSISLSKTGQQHRQETKDKISRSLIMYFKRKNPLSEELGMMYFRSMSEAVSGWLNDVGEEFDSSVNIITEKAIRNKCKIELTCGNNIEYFSHSITPELIILFKEYCDLNNIDPEELLSEVF